MPDSPKERERAVRMAVQIRDARERTSVANQIEAIRQIGELVCLGSAFAVTNNLAAPLAASTLADVLFSSYQRLARFRPCPPRYDSCPARLLLPSAARPARAGRDA